MSIALRLFLFLLPFLIFFAWLWLMRRSKLAKGELDPKTERRLMLGAAAGLALMVAGFIGFAVTVDREIGREYVPPRVEDGRIVPGHFEEKKPEDRTGG